MLITVFVTIFSSPVKAENVFMKDGSILADVKIVSENEDSLTVTTSEKSKKKILRKDILRVNTIELSSRKFYIAQRFRFFKKQGNDFRAYLVDKNDSIYTFRNELNSPEEFSFKKSELLYVADKSVAELIAEGKIKTEISFNMTEVFVLIGSFLCLLIAFVVLQIKRGNRRANMMLALFLITEAIINTLYIYYGRNDLFYKIPQFSDLHFIILTLYAPFLYFYVVLLTRPGFIFKPVHLLHLSVFGLAVLYFAPGIIFLSAGEKMLLHRYYIFKFVDFCMWNSFLIPAVIYLVLTLKMLTIHKNQIKKEFSSTDDISLSWISFMMYILTAGYAVLIVFIVLDFIKGSDFFMFHIWPFFNSSIIVSIGYKGLMQHEIFTDPRTVPSETPDVSDDKPFLQPEKIREIVDKLTAVMDKKRPYLDPSLTLPMLADMIGVPRNYLSLAINDGVSQNFYDFINSYRVREVKKQLDEPDNNEKNLLNLAFNSGFNSKATFNSVFKKNTGMTPTEYKKSISQQDVESTTTPAEDYV